jgi:hypothetical protein
MNSFRLCPERAAEHDGKLVDAIGFLEQQEILALALLLTQ